MQPSTNSRLPIAAFFIFLLATQHSVSAATIEDLVLSRPAGGTYVSIRSVSVHPWFGTGSLDWATAYSELVDKLIARGKNGAYELAPELSLSELMLAVLEKRAAQKAGSVPPTPEVSPDLERLRKEVADLKEAVAAEKDPAKLAKLRRELGEKQKELLVAEASKPARTDVSGDILDNVATNIQKFLLRGGLLVSAAKPPLSDLYLYDGWRRIKVTQSNCIDIGSPVASAMNLDAMTLEGNIAVIDVARTWLVGPLLNSKDSLSLSGTSVGKNFSRQPKDTRLFRITGLVVSRELSALGSLPAEFYKTATGMQLSKNPIYAGCAAVFPVNGLGFDHPIAFPLPTSSGVYNAIPQILGLAITSLPEITGN